MTKKFIQKRSKKVGLSPGSMIYLGEAKGEKVSLSVVDYNENEYVIKDIQQVEESAHWRNASSSNTDRTHGAALRSSDAPGKLPEMEH